jgi:SAM-dependent methyltransferase
VEVRFDEGDAEQLPYADTSFDVVVTQFGAMFAPRPDRVSAELVRVTRPGGEIAMGNWTPRGFIGQMFKLMATHVPPKALSTNCRRKRRPCCAASWRNSGTGTTPRPTAAPGSRRSTWKWWAFAPS